MPAPAVQFGFGSKQPGPTSGGPPSPASIASAVSEPLSTPASGGFLKHLCITGSHLNPSGQAFAPASRLHLKPPSRMLGLKQPNETAHASNSASGERHDIVDRRARLMAA